MRLRRNIGERLHELRDHIVTVPGELPSPIRKAAVSGSEVPAVAQPYTDKVRLHAYKVIDRDVEDLKAAGWTEDEIFELTTAVALGAGLSRLDQVRRALDEAGTR